MPGWQAEIRRAVEGKDWNLALRIADTRLASNPGDIDVRGWRARILTWSGDLTAAEQEYLTVLKAESSDPDYWIGLATVYLRQQRGVEALEAADRAVALDPKRSDIRATRAGIFRVLGDRNAARLEFQRALELDANSTGARSGLVSLDEGTKHEIRVGFDNDLLSYAPANRKGSLSLLSKWNSHWTTSGSATLYQRGGVRASEFDASVTGSSSRYGAVTLGGAGADDHGVVPRSEIFFDVSHGFKLNKRGPARGIEIGYGQHWYWYSTARILTLNETAILYLPRNWFWSLRLSAARSHFSSTGVDWRPSGLTRVAFPIARWMMRSVSGDVFFAVGTEDFAQVDQIGSFASQTYGGGLRFQITGRQHLSGYVAFQQRTQNRADTALGLAYGIRF
jgi:tetratricopeptide (TPR) repeat protein